LESGRLTAGELQGTLAHKEDIESLLLCLDLEAEGVDVADETGIALEEDVLSLRVERLQLDDDPVRSLLGPPDEVDARLGSLLGEFRQGILDARCAADEDGN
jgi:hypothetical protein